MKPTIKAKMQSTYHKDGSVSFFNILTQQWEREMKSRIGDEILATMSDEERQRIRG